MLLYIRNLCVNKTHTLPWSFAKIEPMTKYSKKELAMFQMGFTLGLGAGVLCFGVWILFGSN